MNRKIVCIGLVLVLTLGLLAGCAEESRSQSASSQNSTESGSVENNAGATETSGSQSTEPGVITVTGGKIKGTEKGGVWQFLGVPYAEAKERFVPASEVTSWEGVKDADSYGKISYQGSGNEGNRRPVLSVCPYRDHCRTGSGDQLLYQRSI